MKKLSSLIPVAAGLFFLAVATPSFAAEQSQGKEVTIKGDATCAKCSLKESDKCQTVIQTEDKNGKKVTYYLADNDTAKAFHENVCTASKKVTATGTVKEVKGKQQL